jgi:hypothetical protein
MARRQENGWGQQEVNCLPAVAHCTGTLVAWGLGQLRNASLIIGKSSGGVLGTRYYPQPNHFVLLWEACPGICVC